MWLQVSYRVRPNCASINIFSGWFCHLQSSKTKLRRLLDGGFASVLVNVARTHTLHILQSLVLRDKSLSLPSLNLFSLLSFSSLSSKFLADSRGQKEIMQCNVDINKKQDWGKCLGLPVYTSSSCLGSKTVIQQCYTVKRLLNKLRFTCFSWSQIYQEGICKTNRRRRG